MNKLATLRREPLNLFDYIAFAFLAAACFVLFQQTDLLHTGSSANAYLEGHFLDFYEYNRPLFLGNNYYPSTYIVYAIWNLPLKLFSDLPHSMDVPYPIILWYKLLPVLVYLAACRVIYLICRELKMDAPKSRLCAYAFATTPIAFYSQFIFGQYDIFTAFFMLLGVLYYLRGDQARFILFFAIGTTFKYFALLFFVPLLLLREKNILKIIRDGILSLLPILIETVLYIRSESFIFGVFGFGAAGYIFSVGFTMAENIALSLVVLLYAGICGWAYFTDPKDGVHEASWAFYLMVLVTFLCFGLSMFHPQWMLLVMPFLVISTFMHKKPDVFLLLDIVMMYFFLVFTINIWPNYFDQNLMDIGLLGSLTRGRIQFGITMRQMSPINNLTIAYSVNSGILLVHALFKHPKFLLNGPGGDKTQRAFVRGRFLAGVGLYLIPAMISFVAMFYLPIPLFHVAPISYDKTDELTAGRMIAQRFTAAQENTSKLTVYTTTFERPSAGTVIVQLIKPDTGEVLYETQVNAAAFVELGQLTLRFPPISLKLGQEYEWRFTAPDALPGSAVGFLKTDYLRDQINGYALVDGISQAYNMCMTCYYDTRP